MSKFRSVVVSTALCLILGSAAVIAAPDADYTVGDFAVSLAKMITSKADYTPEQAAAYLERVGVELGDLNAQVDEEAFVGAFNRLGVQLVTSAPDAEVSGDKAGRVFQMFDTNDTLFTGELFRTCQQGDGEPGQCLTDADCAPGHKCKLVNSIKCAGGDHDGSLCVSNADCPGGTCNIPPGQKKKLDLASPTD